MATLCLYCNGNVQPDIIGEAMDVGKVVGYIKSFKPTRVGVITSEGMVEIPYTKGQDVAVLMEDVERVLLLVPA